MGAPQKHPGTMGQCPRLPQILFPRIIVFGTQPLPLLLFRAYLSRPL
jgi:hypothetical protein